MNEIYSDLLAEIAIFGGVNQEAINFILDEATLVNKNAEQYFFHENDIAEDMYILISGEVDVIKNRDGEQFSIAKLHRGECFGEMAILDHYPRSASVICSKKCVALKLDIDCFDKLYHRDMKQFTILQMNIGREVCRRLREVNELLFVDEFNSSLSQVIKVC